MKLRDRVFAKFGGRCAYCGWMLNDKWQVDHAISKCYWFMVDPEDMKAVNNFENLNPACKECNHYKRSHCVESFYHHVGFREYMMKFHIRLGKLPKKTMVAKTTKRKAYMYAIADRYNITPTQPFSGKFYFETLSSVRNDEPSVATGDAILTNDDKQK